MKDIFLLTKILFKNSLGKNINEKNNNKSKFGTMILIFAVSAYLIGVLGVFSYQIIDTLIKVRQEEVFISFSLLIICGFTLFRTIFTAINILYFSKDVEFLLPMPIEPIKIVFAKFNIMLISNYITEVIMFGIPYVIYWYMLKLKVTFLISSLLVFLVIPIIPMLISSLIIVFIMRFTSFLKNKDVVQYISVFITVGIVLGMQFLNNSSNNVTNFVLANKIVEINGYSSVLSRYFFTVKQAVEVLTSTENISVFKNLGLLYFESIFSFIICVFLISKMYLDSAVKATVSGIKTRKPKTKELNKKSVGKTYILKEFKLLFRTPVYLFQCVLPSFIFPIIFSIPIYKNLKETGNSGISIMDFDVMFNEIINSGFGFGILLVAITFLYSFNFMSVTSVSREGENALFMKYIPIPLSRQYKYKAIPGIIINLVPLIYVLVIIKILFTEIGLYFYLQIILVSLLCNILINYFSVIIDVLKPKLHWSSEYAVVKQNMNMLYSFILCLLLMGIFIGVASYIDNVNILTAVLSAIMLLLLIVFEIFLKKYEHEIFKKIS